MTAESALLSELAGIVGPEHVLTAPRDLAPMLTDNRGRWHGQALACVLPASTGEVSRVMAALARSHAFVVVQGGNTGNAAAATPVLPEECPGPAVLLSLRRMRAVEKIDPVNNTATVQAGVVLEALQQAAREHRRLFPLSLAAQGSCQIGGCLAVNAGGVHVLRYGNTRDLTLGLEVVLPDGRVLDMLRGLRKDNTGYDLRDLFIGSEGTLGVITRAVVKLFPEPTSRVVAVCALEKLTDAERLFERLESSLGPSLTAFELMHADPLRMVRRQMPQVPVPFSLDAPWHVLVEESCWGGAAGRLEETLAELLEEGAACDAVVSQSEAQAQALWTVRESIPGAHKKAGGNVKHDVSVPRSALCAFVEQTCALLREQFPWIAPSVFGHFGDGNLHFNMGVREGFDSRLAFEHEEEIHRTVYDQIRLFSGSIAAEHGVGRLKCSLVPLTRGAVERGLWEAVRSAFDPEHRMNPGAVLPYRPNPSDRSPQP